MTPNHTPVTRRLEIRRDPRHRVSLLVNDWERVETVISAARAAASESLQHDYEPASARDGNFACGICGQDVDDKNRHIKSYGAAMADLFTALEEIGAFTP